MERLRQRKDFLAAAGGASASTGGFVLQERQRGDSHPPRIGLTVSRKVGGAVERNRVRRQFRELVRLCAATHLKAGSDYVMVARRAALGMPFMQLAADFAVALKRLDRGRRNPSTTTGGSGGSPARRRASGDQSTI